MRAMKLLGMMSSLALCVACGSGSDNYDATGTFEATEVTVSAEAAGRLLFLDV